MKTKFIYIVCMGWIFFAFIGAPFTTDAAANTYYVAKNGDDSNPGTEALPWLTVQKAASTLQAGDMVYIKSGTYTEQVSVRKSGTPGNSIIFSVYPGDKAVINGTNIKLPQWGGLFEISGKGYIKIEGLRIINARPHDNNTGILVDNSHNITLVDNSTYNTTSSGIGIWNSRNIVIDGNEVELACNDGEQECITVAVTNGFEVKNNHVHHSGPGSMGGEGIDAKDGSSHGKVYNNYVHHIQRLGIYVDSWDKHTHNIEVYQNIVHDCAEDGFSIAAEAGGLLENVSLYNNIAYNNHYSGLTIASWGKRQAKHPMKDIKIINNTFFQNGSKEWGGGISVENKNIDGLLIRNNILNQNFMFQILLEVKPKHYLIDHNLTDGFRDYQGEIYGEKPVKGNPRFLDPASFDFHLRKESPAVDTGSTDQAPENDFDGNPRPWGSGIDIGAYEYKDKPIRPEIALNNTKIKISCFQGGKDPINAKFKIRNSGTDTLNYKIRSNRKWIYVKPEKGRSMGEWDRIKAFLLNSGLSLGRHTGKITVISRNACNSPQKIKIVLMVKK
jgi:parallel beta-helix repeat protein